MPSPLVSYRQHGSGPTVICIHAAVSTGKQWRPLEKQLEGSFRVVADDLYGDGNSPPCPVGRDFSIDDEVALIQSKLQEVDRFHLVGHSYGGSVAIKVALSDPARVASLVLYEPALWGMLATYWPDDHGTREILDLRDETLRLIGLGDKEAATQGFVDYWRPNTWENTAEKRRSALVEGMLTTGHKWKSNLGLSVSPEELNALDVPTLVLTGSNTAKPARDLMNRLSNSVARWRRIVELRDVGHMGPITEPAIVNAPIASFLHNAVRRNS